jgi:hypothetical protein
MRHIYKTISIQSIYFQIFLFLISKPKLNSKFDIEVNMSQCHKDKSHYKFLKRKNQKTNIH